MTNLDDKRKRFLHLVKNPEAEPFQRANIGVWKAPIDEAEIPPFYRFVKSLNEKMEAQFGISKAFDMNGEEGYHVSPITLLAIAKLLDR